MSIAEKQKTISSNNTAISEKNVSIATNTQKIYTSGYGKGYSLGNKDGRDEGYNIGRAAGYDDGYKSGEDNGIAEMWEVIQNGGKQETYYERFRNWKITKKTFAPKYDIRPTATNGLNYAFANLHKADSNEIIDFEEIERECGIVIDFSPCQVMHNTFQAAEIDVVNVFDARNANGSNALYSTFRGYFDNGDRPGHHTVKRINKFIVGENTNNFYMTFYYATDLEHCGFEGEISKNGLSFTQSTKLDHESLMSVINCLKDYSADTSGTTWTVQFGATNLAKLTAEEKAIAAQKGWNLT